ncbi:glycosyltransferase [Aeromonas veronii]|nr:glycosyltransferase [Aeromonas veronii]
MISVLLATNKIDEYLWLAIDSILEQKDIDFELIVIANGLECDQVFSDISARLASTERVILLKTPVPQLAYALNLGLSSANTDIIARMDADDIALPTRLVSQYSYMTKNGLDLVGTDIFVIDSQGLYKGKKEYPRGDMINKLLPFRNCFCHPSVMCKKKMLYDVRGYNSGFNSEDYDLWLRAMRLGVKWDNMSEPLLQYRVHLSSAQGTRLAYAECLALSVREFFLKKSLSRFLAMCCHAVKFLYKKMR